MSTAPQPNLRGPKGSRFRLAVVLLLMFATILGGKFWEDIYVENLRFDCGSLYRDRLMPAVVLFRLGDQIHNKREALEEYLHGDVGSNEPSIDYRLGQSDAAIRGHIDQIKRTYLVDEESRLLTQLQEALSSYNKKEAELIRRYRGGEHATYGADMREAFSIVRAELVGLTQVQEVVGQELNQDSLASASHVTSLLYFQLGVTFILGLLASGLAMSLEAHTVPSAAPRDKGLH